MNDIDLERKLNEILKKLNSPALEMLSQDIMTARICLNFSGAKCDNNDCLNESCPLHKRWKK